MNGFREALQRARELGELAPDARPERLARSLTTTVYGLGLLSRLPSSGPRVGDAVAVMLELLDETNNFAIIGYQGLPSPSLWTYPDRSGLAQATTANLADARNFVLSLARRFSGSTPTHYALLSALQYPADAVILLSDGEPDNSPGFIIQDITGLNRYQDKEIHTVAIGDYTQNRGLVMFLQTLARQNGGDFVGVSR